MDPVSYLNNNLPLIAFEGQKGKIEGQGFEDTLKSLISNVDSQMKESAQLSQDFATGKNRSIHEVMIASETAGISLRFLIQIRNKLLEGYQEIMRMNF